MKAEIERLLQESIDVKKRTLALSDQIAAAIEAIVAAYRAGNKLIIFGNGGSAADAQHVAGELVNKFRFAREPLPAIALTTDTSVLTAIANDSSYDNVFAYQVKALCSRGDVVVALTTSDVAETGHSANIYRAVVEARKKGARIIALCSERSVRLAGMADIALQIPSSDTPRVQESHITILHIVCELVEKELFGK